LAKLKKSIESALNFLHHGSMKNLQI